MSTIFSAHAIRAVATHLAVAWSAISACEALCIAEPRGAATALSMNLIPEHLPKMAIVGSAPMEASALRALGKHQHVIAADGGANHCLSIGLAPLMIIGDMDSIGSSALSYYEKVPIERFPCDKDDSDLELAVAHASRARPERIELFGVLGGRLDHTLSVLQLLARHPKYLYAVGDNEVVFALADEIILKTAIGQRISIFSAPGASLLPTVVTKGLKWELASQQLNTSFCSLSNMAIEESIVISVKSGIALVVVEQPSEPASEFLEI